MFFLETTGPFVTKWKAFKNKEMKINKYDFGHKTNMAAMPVYGKIILKKRLLRNQWTDCLETWYGVLGSRGPS